MCPKLLIPLPTLEPLITPLLVRVEITPLRLEIPEEPLWVVMIVPELIKDEILPLLIRIASDKLRPFTLPETFIDVMLPGLFIEIAAAP